jgi:hypothetical protein
MSIVKKNVFRIFVILVFGSVFYACTSDDDIITITEEEIEAFDDTDF